MNPKRLLTASVCALGLAASGPYAAATPISLCELNGTDLQGGAASVYGSTHAGELQCNYVYAQSNGEHSRMQAQFALDQIPAEPLFLYVKGCDDDGPAKCAISIEVNSKPLFSAKNEFPDKGWQIRKFAIPQGLLQSGENTLRIANSEPSGPMGNVPWFMVARCAIAPDGFSFVRNVRKDFWFTLPDVERPFPEPLPAGQEPGFKLRGIKGWLWRPEVYLSEIPILARYQMNFLMNCYGSMCDIEHYAWGNPEVNRWWEDLPAGKKATFEQIVRECQKNKIEFCFSMNPNLCSKRPLIYSSAQDIDQLWKHYSWMQCLGVKWFNISLDDISQGIDAAGQAKVVNEILRRLRANDPQARMIFTPTIYWGDGTSTNDRAYLETLAKDLDPEVYLFWTGNSVVGNITRSAAESYRKISGHKLFLWDNYPVNDGQATMHLGPLVNRDPGLGEVIDGYMSNPLHQQVEANRIPMLTCADYAYNPKAYDPVRSIGQAILHLESNPERQNLLRELVERYPGFILYGKPQTGLNPVREQFNKLMAIPHARYITEAYIRDLERFAARLDRAFPDCYQPERKTVRDDLEYLRKLETNHYSE